MKKQQWWTVAVPRLLAADRALAPAARFVYMVIKAYASQAAAGEAAADKGALAKVSEATSVRCSLQQLAQLSGLGSRTPLGRYLDQLQQAGWLSVEKGSGRRPNTYRFVEPPHAKRAVVPVPATLIGQMSLPLAAKVLYAALLAHRAPGAQAFVARRPELVATVGVGSDGTVRRLLHHLVRAGWVRLEPASRTDLIAYEPLDPHRRMREAERERARQLLDDQTYVGEPLMKLMLTALVDDQAFIDNARPDFLTNPYTGHLLELDRWYTAAGIAFEFNGPQHDGPTRAFPDRDQANQQRGRDLMKFALAGEHGIKLIVVKPRELTFERLGAKIGTVLPLRVLRREDPLVAYLARVSRNYVRKVGEEQL